MLHRFVLHNGELRGSSDQFLAPGQVGLLAGWGVFSTIRIVEGVPFAFERHWARMRKDAETLHVPLPPHPEKVLQQLLRLVEANRAFNSTLRIIIVRNCGGMWEGPGNERPSDLIAFTADSKEWGCGVRLCYRAQARHSRCEFTGTKITSWAMNLTWLEQAQAKGFDEVILLNERGEVAECTSANIFVAQSNKVWTPPLSSGCLPGITREILLSEIHVPGLEIVERTMLPHDLARAGEVFITSTTRELLAVVEIDGVRIRNEGAARSALQSAFSDYTDRYISTRKDVSVSPR